MKWTVVILVVCGIFTPVFAQQQLGFSTAAQPGPTVKLEGITVSQFTGKGGYIAVSVPAKDISRFLVILSKLEPHVALLELLDRLDRESKMITPTASGPVAPLGICLIVTNELFQHRHKVLDREVQQVGSYSYPNAGRLVTIPVYSGGPSAR